MTAKTTSLARKRLECGSWLTFCTVISSGKCSGWGSGRCCGFDLLLGRNRLGVHEVLERTEGRLGAVAGGDDDLLVRHRRRIAGSEDVGYRGASFGIDHDFAEPAELHDALQEVRVGQKPDLHEHTF